MRAARFACAALGAAATLAAIALAWSNVPLGWPPREWVWNRAVPPAARAFLIPGAAAAGFVALAAWGRARLARTRSPLPWLLGLLAAGTLAPAALVELPAAGFGMERWPLALAGKASSGYFARARELADAGTAPRAFLAGYQAWIAEQDNFHMGTHPPGLIAIPWAALEACRAWPRLADALLATMPSRFAAGLALLPDRLPAADRAALWLLALAMWAASTLAALPVWALARWRGTPEDAWAAAALWLLAPGPLLFLPLGDVLYPVLAAGWVWLAMFAADRNTRAAATLLGAAAAAAWLAGMACSLAFVATLPIAGLAALLARRPNTGWAMVGFVAGAAGGLALARLLADLDLLAVWRINLAKHAGFYRHFPRTYAVWVWLDLVEFAVACGPWVVVAWLAQAARGRAAPLAAAGAATLLALDASGKNLSEVARLWLFLMPFAAAGAGPWTPRAFVIALALQAGLAAALLARVEPLLPVALGGG